MGIKHLNRFLRTNCSDSIKCVPISDLSGKKIAVDISIYMYKFAGDNSLIENMYLMITTFRYYNIIPIFIFDGKPIAEKKELLQKRKKDKLTAEKEYNNLKKQLESNNVEDEDKPEIITNMDMLKKQFIYITKDQINSVKQLMVAYGITYYDAPEEADELCALLVIKKIVWGCLSEDTDMFVYGCPRVLRYLSLLNRNVVVYNTKKILEDLGITQKEFREICVLSGTDYNINTNFDSNNHNNHNDLHKSLKLFKKYHKSLESKTMEFYEWLKNKDYISDYKLLVNIYNIFDLSLENLKNFDKIKITNGPVIRELVQPILKEDGFIFSN